MILSGSPGITGGGAVFPHGANEMRPGHNGKRVPETAMRLKKFYPLIGAAAAALLCLFFLFAFEGGNGPGGSSSSRMNAIFSSEDEYINFIKNKVSFDEITLDIVEIRKGDNFWKMARKRGVNIDTLIGSNPHWNALTARVNQKVVVPSCVGVLHFITDFAEIEELPSLYGARGEEIIVQKLPPFFRLASALGAEERPVAVFIRNARPTTLMMTREMAQKYALREMFRSPLGGRYSSFFGGRVHPIFREYGFHNGVDIAAPYGTPVGAARTGTVTSTGWMGGYGKAVIINHSQGYRTLYGHLSVIYVRPGQRVNPGRLVGKVGSTGWSTGPHLHFTIWHNGRLINPMQVLW